MKLKYTEIKPERESRYEQQGKKCYLCGEDMDANNKNKLVQPVLDHCHSTGRVRAVIHGDCNVLLGKVENFTTFKGKSMVREGRLEQALEGMFAYMSADYSTAPHHPTYKSPQEKKTISLRKKYLRLRKKAKTSKTKNKYTKLLGELK